MDASRMPLYLATHIQIYKYIHGFIVQTDKVKALKRFGVTVIGYKTWTNFVAMHINYFLCLLAQNQSSIDQLLLGKYQR